MQNEEDEMFCFDNLGDTAQLNALRTLWGRYICPGDSEYEEACEDAIDEGKVFNIAGGID